MVVFGSVVMSANYQLVNQATKECVSFCERENAVEKVGSAPASVKIEKERFTQ